MRGCGRSTRGLPDGQYSPAAAASGLAALLDALRIGQADVLGFSCGGLIAQRPDASGIGSHQAGSG
jgi:pimeloyl-ACP methyl ester carboxylesterase